MDWNTFQDLLGFFKLLRIRLGGKSILNSYWSLVFIDSKKRWIRHIERCQYGVLIGFPCVSTDTPYLYDGYSVLRYLKGQPKLGLWYPRDSPFDLEAFFDSDYAKASLDRKSTTGGCQFLGRRLISWQCKKQTIVANSTTEGEYVAAANCCGQISQSSGPIHLIAYETIYKEWEDRMERAATTTSSLEAEQNS
ncbi:hypothetical protein Tco_1352912, partial [Tanacetum coccineum]